MAVDSCVTEVCKTDLFSKLHGLTEGSRRWWLHGLLTYPRTRGRGRHSAVDALCCVTSLYLWNLQKQQDKKELIVNKFPFKHFVRSTINIMCLYFLKIVLSDRTHLVKHKTVILCILYMYIVLYLLTWTFDEMIYEFVEA